MFDILRALARNEKGATAIEYGLIVALIVIAMAVAVTSLGNITAGMWNDISVKVDAAS